MKTTFSPIWKYFTRKDNFPTLAYCDVITGIENGLIIKCKEEIFRGKFIMNDIINKFNSY